ncbi:hypothetical protein HZA96_00875 [Candidatus Woesearchaeota archaeon]|nr:hypothetical protein [Candidatus Woesearchaeota archaeon]
MVLKLELQSENERKFRELAMRKYGFSRGAIKKAGEEALKRWIKQEDRGTLPRKDRDPLKSLYGAMKHLHGKKTSVQLQHEALQLWAKQN